MEQLLSCEKIITTIGGSDVIIPVENKVVTAKNLDWIFKIPKNVEITAKITENGGTITFLAQQPCD